MLNQAKILQAIIFLFFSILTGSITGQTELTEKTTSIQKELEEIRGEKFKKDVLVEKQSLDDFGAYIDKSIDLQFSEALSKNFGKIVRTLGLYRGEEIKDFKSVAKMVMQSQAAAYYDPDKGTFYIVMQNLPEQMLDAVFAHELYHGFQDQHFNLNNYFLRKSQEGQLNDDQLLARQAVVEGEATYLMTLWTTQKMLGMLPDLSMLKMAMDMQANLTTKQLLEMVKSAVAANPTFEDIKLSANSMNDIPGFMLDSMIGAYMKGMRFIYEIHQNGWSKVSELYKNPPVSTEQILHPEKWLSMEKPHQFKWPDFEKQELLNDWILLEKNTLGEMQWRSIFSEFDMASIGNAAAEGWDGDSYAIFESSDMQRTLLLVTTSWDSEKDATEFKNAYSTLLASKYENNKGACKRLNQIGTDVYIIESSKEENCDQLLKFIKKVEKRK